MEVKIDLATVGLAVCELQVASPLMLLPLVSSPQGFTLQQYSLSIMELEGCFVCSGARNRKAFTHRELSLTKVNIPHQSHEKTGCAYGRTPPAVDAA